MYRRCGCVETAADIVQEAYQRLLSGNLWQQAENPRALLHRIAANLATDYERRNTVRQNYLSNQQAQIDTLQQQGNIQPERIISAEERLELLLAAVNTLPPKCRRVFVLRKFEDLSQADIALRLGISRNMVEKHLRHALTVLQRIDDL
ncbi:MAG: RNA polymerase sigma factor [Methylovulum sp.]